MSDYNQIPTIGQIEKDGRGTRSYTVGGKTYNTSYGGTGAMWNISKSERRTLMDAIIANGGALTDAQLLASGIVSGGSDTKRFSKAKEVMNRFIDQNAAVLGYDTAGNHYDADGNIISSSVDPSNATGNLEDTAFNEYWNDLYNPNVEGTKGNAMLTELEGGYQREANANAEMANIQYQNAQLQQAATIKSITDQVRSERMARLKAGMSEAQIANQDMQQMMTNVNALNENAAMLGQNRMQAAAGQNVAKDQAYQDYLNQANSAGQNAAAMTAADAANLDFQIKQRQKQTGESYEVAAAYVSTGAGLSN